MGYSVPVRGKFSTRRFWGAGVGLLKRRAAPLRWFWRLKGTELLRWLGCWRLGYPKVFWRIMLLLPLAFEVVIRRDFALLFCVFIAPVGVAKLLFDNLLFF